MLKVQIFLYFVILSASANNTNLSKNIADDVSSPPILDLIGNFMDTSAIEDILFDLAGQLEYDTLQQILGLYNNVTAQLATATESIFNESIRCDYVKNLNISQGCKSQAEVICKNATLLLTMLDASSKLYPGILYGTKLDYGNFDECLSIDHSDNDTRILGKFLANGIVIPTNLNGTEEQIFHTAYKFSICVPDQCTPDDISTALSIPSDLPIINDRFATTKYTDTEISIGDTIVGGIFILFFVLMIVSTAYDYYLQKTANKPSSELFIAFSTLTNVNKLLKTSKKSSEQICVLHGLKFISIAWIIAGHGFLAFTYEIIPVSNNAAYKNYQWMRYAQYITTAYIAVDTFFFISGFLLAYQYLKQENTSLKGHLIKVPFLYFHRYLRLTPALLMVFLYTITLNAHTGLGPIAHYARENLIKGPCVENWWSVFLYIQNYYNYNDLCLVPTWYISADMQIFFLAPLVLIPLALQIGKNYKNAMIQLLCLNVFLTVMPIFTELYFTNYVNSFATHLRLVNFFVGVMLGAYMRKNTKFIFTESTNLLIWVITLLGMFAIFLGYQEVEINYGFVGKTVFHCLRRPFWCMGLCWIIYSCHHGYGGIVNWILTRGLCQIGGKLSYCMYLLHCSVGTIYFFSIKERIHFSDYEVFYLFCGHFMVTIIVSVFWTLAFESPLITIQKVMLQGKSRPTGTSSNRDIKTAGDIPPQLNKSDAKLHV